MMTQIALLASSPIQPTGDTGVSAHLSSVDMGEAIAAGSVKLTKGTPEEVAELFDLFDKFVPEKNYSIPPLED